MDTNDNHVPITTTASSTSPRRPRGRRCQPSSPTDNTNVVLQRNMSISTSSSNSTAASYRSNTASSAAAGVGHVRLERSISNSSDMSYSVQIHHKPKQNASWNTVRLLRGLVVVLGLGASGTFLLQTVYFSAISTPGSTTTTSSASASRGLLSVSKSPVANDISSQSSAKDYDETGSSDNDDAPMKIPLQSDVFQIPTFPDIPPQATTTKGSFAACLIIKDDNHWLIEWLAYHYHVMPLRRLIVAVDPNSKTSPTQILKRWQFLMDITVWSDSDFMPAKPKKRRLHKHHNVITHAPKKAEPTIGKEAVDLHRKRQNNFYIKCMQHLQRERQQQETAGQKKKDAAADWLHLTDTDEFIAINYASGPLYNLTKYHPIQQPGSVLQFLQHFKDATQEIQDAPEQEDPACMYMPRYMFGAKEAPSKLLERNLPKSLKTKLRATDFLTQRYMYRNTKRMSNGKNLIHLSALHNNNNNNNNGADNWKPMANVHRVASSCPSTDATQNVDFSRQTLLKIHHYLGSPEQYAFRQDPRNMPKRDHDHQNKNVPDQPPPPPVAQKQMYFARNPARYNALDQAGVYADAGARGWIAGFLQDPNIGVPMAEYLLQGVGHVGVE